MKEQVVLLSTHFLNEYVVQQYRKLLLEISEFADLFLLLEIDNESDFCTDSENIQCYFFNIDSLNALNYEPLEESIVPGSNHFQVLLFYKDYPHYEYYWNIEYDVYFNGKWEILFERFRNIKSDFISSHIKRQPECPDWVWWESLHLKTLSIPLPFQLKSFNPIYRISKNALKELDKVLSEGNSGHHEVLIPSVLNYLGYTVKDWGGTGAFIFPEFENSFYLSNSDISEENYIGSTMRYRPSFSLKEIRKNGEDNLLYHPIKLNDE